MIIAFVRGLAPDLNDRAPRGVPRAIWIQTSENPGTCNDDSPKAFKDSIVSNCVIMNRLVAGLRHDLVYDYRRRLNHSEDKTNLNQRSCPLDASD